MASLKKDQWLKPILKDKVKTVLNAVAKSLRLALFFGLVPLHSSFAQDEIKVCDSFIEPQITIQPVQSTEQYNNDLYLDDLRKMAGDPNVGAAGLREMPVGLTVSNLRLDSSFEIMTQSDGSSNQVCAQVARINLYFGFSDTKVYLAKEIPQNSCGYNEVLQHERHHIAIDQKVMSYYLPQLQELMANLLHQTGIIRAKSPQEAESQIRQRINAYLRDLGANIAHVREEYQHEFDSLAEYERLSKSCNGELAGLIGRALQSPSL